MIYLNLPNITFIDIFICKILLLFIFLFTKIKWENRLIGDSGQRCLVTIDGVDFPIPEPTAWSKKWYSHKFEGPGIRYEIAVSIFNGWIVLYNGPFQCGAWSDKKIFKSLLILKLANEECVVADCGYKDTHRVCHPDMGTPEQQRAMEVARARHETVNGRLKNWESMKRVFRHNRDKHHLVFRSVLVIEQIKIQNGRPPFQVDPVVDPI